MVKISAGILSHAILSEKCGIQVPGSFLGVHRGGHFTAGGNAPDIVRNEPPEGIAGWLKLSKKTPVWLTYWGLSDPVGHCDIQRKIIDSGFSEM
jgi:hypothetical protein